MSKEILQTSTLREEKTEIDFEILTKDNYPDLLQFECGLFSIDNFFKKEAKKSSETVTYLCYERDDSREKLFGAFSLSCTTLIVKEDGCREFKPAIEILKFGIVKEYQGKYPEETYLSRKNIPYAAIMLSFAISEAKYIAESHCGAIYLVLYSVPEQEGFYKLNGFRTFNQMFVPKENSYESGCMPMFMKIN